MQALICGLGIAGPTLAYWLRRAGWTVTIAERSPAPRQGGYIVDFWGPGYDIAERMGLLPRLNERGYFVQEVRLVNAEGKRVGGFSADVFTRATRGRFVSLPRTELASAIHDAVAGGVEAIWDDTITGIQSEGERLNVTFERAAPRSFDLVFGADGLHSPVRSLWFAGEGKAEVELGYSVAAFDAEHYPIRDEDVYVSYSEPGRQVARFSERGDRTLFLFVFADEAGPDPRRMSLEQKRQTLYRRFAGAGWETPQILESMMCAEDIYFDNVSQIRIPAWTRGRVALLGDAAACPSLLAGEGSSLAMAEAYVLAGELARAEGDHGAAFARYEQIMRPFIARKQRAAAGLAASFAPRTRFGITLRNLVTRAFAIPGAADLFIGGSLKNDLELPSYAF